MIRITMAATPRAAALAACLATALALPRAAGAQAVVSDSWRISAAVGAFVPRAAMIVAGDGSDTRLGAGPSFSLELHYLAADWAALYAGGAAAFTALALGTEISPTAIGGSDQAALIALTGGVVLTFPIATDIQPTFRIGGGLKGYTFDLPAADGQWRPTGDFGIGFRGLGTGPLEVSAEVRYLPSSFDQAGLPTRSIEPQLQRQTDLLFAVGISVRQ
jgi:hypothetical protein